MEILEYKNMKDLGADIVPVSFAYEQPERNVEKYFVSKVEHRNSIKQYPQWDIVGDDAQAQTLRLRNELAVADAKLHKKRKQYFEQVKNLDVQWEELAKLEQQLKEYFISNNKFVKDNQMKKARAVRVIEFNRERLERKEEIIVQLQEKIDILITVRENLKENVEKLQIYENYLHNFVLASPVFKDITQVLRRYDALLTAQKDLTYRQDVTMDKIEDTRTEMVTFIENKTNAVFGLRNRLNSQQTRYMKARQNAIYWEHIVQKLRVRTNYDLLRVCAVYESIWSLYRQMCLRQNNPIEYRKDQVEEQLTYIKNTILAYKYITRHALKNNSCQLSSRFNTNV